MIHGIVFRFLDGVRCRGGFYPSEFCDYGCGSSFGLRGSVIGPKTTSDSREFQSRCGGRGVWHYVKAARLLEEQVSLEVMLRCV